MQTRYQLRHSPMEAGQPARTGVPEDTPAYGGAGRHADPAYASWRTAQSGQVRRGWQPRQCSRYGHVKVVPEDRKRHAPASLSLGRWPGTTQGRRDSNPRRAVLEAAVLAAELRPFVKMSGRNRNRPLRAFPGGGGLLLAWSSRGPPPGNPGWRRAALTGWCARLA